MIGRSLIQWMSMRDVRVLLVATVVSLGVTLGVQLVVLSLVWPTWGEAHGLLEGHDSVRFHAIAAAQAALIQAEGWGAWELRPNGWGVSGLMSAWYVWFGPYPASWAFVQSVSYGLSVMILFGILAEITRDRVLAAFSVLPALLLPSTMAIYVFPHRDVFVFLGLMLAVFGFVRLGASEEVDERECWLRVGTGGAAILAGFFVSGMVRVFTGELFLGVAVVGLSVLIVHAVLRVFREQSIRYCIVVAPVMVVALIGVMASVDKGGHFDAELRPLETRVAVTPAALGGDNELIEKDAGWRPTAWLPGRVDGKLRRVAGARDRVLRMSGHGRTIIDAEVQFRSTEDFLKYVPRALQIGLFSPFPEMWKPHPEAPAYRNLERAVVGGEMMILYGLFPFLLLAIWLYRRQTALWVALLPAIGWVWVYATTVPVVGALVRYRYGAYILIIAIAMAGLGEAVRRVYDWARARAA